MPTNGKSDVVFKWMLGILSTMICFCLVWLFNTNADFKVMQSKLDQISSDKEDDERQDSQLSKHWQIHSWTRDQINEIRQASSLPIVSWPVLK